MDSLTGSWSGFDLENSGDHLSRDEEPLVLRYRKETTLSKNGFRTNSLMISAAEPGNFV